MSYQWTCLTENAPFAPRDGAGALVFNGRMWLLGGWNPDDKVYFPRICNSEVWSSEDGLHWKLELLQAPWEGRHTAGYAVHRGQMWVLGGDVNQGHYQNDVWSSSDGVHWELAVQDVPWAPRALHHTAVFQDKIWVMGGQTLPTFSQDAPEIYYDDVWNSEDGLNWRRVTTNAHWAPRGMIGGSAVFKDRLWILGGGTYSTPQRPQRLYYNDVWSSVDGVSWAQDAAFTAWEARQYHDVAVFDEKLWVLEGCNAQGNRNDVWHSSDGTHWTELPNTPWLPRHASSIFVFNNALWVVAGNNMTSDVWKLERVEQ